MGINTNVKAKIKGTVFEVMSGFMGLFSSDSNNETSDFTNAVNFLTS
jgi:hypothetical protein